MFSPRRLLVVLAVVLVAAACGNGNDLDVVASVNGADITIDEVAVSLENEPSTASVVDRIDLGSPEAARVIGTLIILEAVRDDAEALGVTMPDTDNPVEGGLQGPINQLVADMGLALVPELTEAERVDRIAEIAAGYDDDTGAICASHILVLTDDFDQIEAAAQRVADGEPFADVAREVSVGPSGPDGGSLGCAPASNYVTEFADALKALGVDEVSEPVESSFGWHIIERHDSEQARADQAVGEVDQAVGLERQTTLNAWFADRVATAEVDLDPAVGIWENGSLVPASLADGR